MAESPLPNSDDAAPEATQPAQSPSGNRRSPWWQLPLRTMLLLLTAIGVWAVVWGNQRAIHRSQLTVETLRPLARELIVTDPLAVTVVHREPTWYDENTWELNLPAGAKYRLCIGTREIVEAKTPTSVKSRSVPAGKCTVTLEREQTGNGPRVVVRFKEQEWLVVEETPDWDPGRGSMGGSTFSICSTLQAGQPVVLFHRRFMVPQGSSYVTPNGPSNGVVVWLEPE